MKYAIPLQLFPRSAGLDTEGMYFPAHQVPDGTIDHAMTLNHRVTPKRLRDYPNGIVTATGAMACMIGGIVLNLHGDRRQCRSQSAAQLLFSLSWFHQDADAAATASSHRLFSRGS